MELTTGEIDRIIGFLGYGRTTAPVWFIGIEEGLGKMKGGEPERNLRTRGTFEPVMDLQEAHMKLLEDKKPMDLSAKKTFTPVWLWMAKIMRALPGASYSLEEAKKYIQAPNGLGRRYGDTFLTELSPIPERNNQGREYSKKFMSVDPDIQAKIEVRRLELKRILNHHNPRLVICYGSGKLKKFEGLLGVELQSVGEDASVRGKVYRSADSRRFLLPFFGNGWMSDPALKRLVAANPLF